MELDEFLSQVGNFASLTDTDQVKHFAWFLYRHRGMEAFDTGSVRKCYSGVGMHEPNVSEQISRLYDRKQIVKSGNKYRLERSEREALDRKYGDLQQTIAISDLLASLPGKISDSNEKTFLDEVLKCYRAQAFRGSTVMTWNLAYDHLLGWIADDAKRLDAFNASLVTRLGSRRAGTVMQTREDFEALKEREVIDVVHAAKVIDKGMWQTLDMGLTRRNQAAHPSSVAIRRAMAEDMIDSLVTNVVLKLN
jgi:hypothetical protein